ncbi:hypothetical protein SMJ63A_10249 [Stenotrophomonas geniculata]
MKKAVSHDGGWGSFVDQPLGTVVSLASNWRAVPMAGRCIPVQAHVGSSCDVCRAGDFARLQP